MELYTIDTKTFKNLFLQSAVPMWLLVGGSFVIVNNGYITLPNFDPLHKYSWMILLGMVILAVIYAYWRKKQLKQVYDQHTFEAEIRKYQNVYRLTMGWYLFSCIVSIALYLFTTRSMFLFFALYDVVISLQYYPTRSLFKRELRNDEIILQ